MINAPWYQSLPSRGEGRAALAIWNRSNYLRLIESNQTQFDLGSRLIRLLPLDDPHPGLHGVQERRRAVEPLGCDVDRPSVVRVRYRRDQKPPRAGIALAGARGPRLDDAHDRPKTKRPAFEGAFHLGFLPGG